MVLHCVNVLPLTDVPVDGHWVSRSLAIENNGAVSILVCTFDTYHAFLPSVFLGIGLLGCPAFMESVKVVVPVYIPANGV